MDEISIKPMVIVTTNGRFVEIFGPYKANNNDASILKSILEEYSTEINGILQNGN